MFFPFSVNGAANPDAVVSGPTYRFTLLTDHILRIEYDPEGVFEDRPSQTVLCRNFAAPEYSVHDRGGILEIDTRNYHLVYHHNADEPFSKNNLFIDAKNDFTNYCGRWQYGEEKYGDPPRHFNLYGTARTLDRIDGDIPLEFGLIDKSGRTFFDDSETALIADDLSLVPRRSRTTDVYYICCQHDYEETLADFFRLSGRPPMIPRYALGNWWSRYHTYTEKSYLDLMDRFKKENIPISVAVLDMDWHITQVAPEFGNGWTGFTWNRELFPSPSAFLDALHQEGLHVFLNLHPADGIRPYEEAYERMALAAGTDPDEKRPVLFDLTSKAFRDAYFSELIEPLEKEGVDHWWIDWQQGRSSAVPNLDPLWLLNHFHFLRNSHENRRGLILSRYAGLGSHRYPAGFSGDTVASWDSLAFQAYFTATSSNAGFPFWSHDIGGFKDGTGDPELTLRWYELGVFSPFFRLHSTKNVFSSKEPWNIPGSGNASLGAAWMRFRHRLIPYLYSELYRQHESLVPLIRPMYYMYPEENRAYEERCQYLFGSSLMVCPIVSKSDEITHTAGTRAWIPDGLFTDIFTGKNYEGRRVMMLNRDIGAYPVLALPGAIVPLACESDLNSTKNPVSVDVLVFPGGDGSYDMFEDDGISHLFENGKLLITHFTFSRDSKTFTIRAEGDFSVSPAFRTYRVLFRGFSPLQAEGAPVASVSYDQTTRTSIVTLRPTETSECISFTVSGTEPSGKSETADDVFRFLASSSIQQIKKKKIYNDVLSGVPAWKILEELAAERADIRFIDVMNELLT